MAGGNLLALFDDIASVLDDVAAMSKVAAEKTAGVLGDDLALNAEQVAGVTAERELPVVWAVAKGALLNKIILVPVALFISGISPALITGLLMIGGLYLCYEGAEKLFHRKTPSAEPNKAEEDSIPVLSEEEEAALEAKRIRGAIRTDFILSAEIIVIALGTMEGSPLAQRAIALSFVALAMTVGIYGLVALIVRLDNIGAAVVQGGGRFVSFGHLLLRAAPRVIKLLGVLGMVAMFLVGGGIIAHGIGAVHHWIGHVAAQVGALASVVEPAMNGLVGLLAGALLLGVAALKKTLFKASSESLPA